MLNQVRRGTAARRPDCEDWQFLTLHDQLVTIDTRRYYLNQPEELLGVLEWIVGRFVRVM